MECNGTDRAEINSFHREKALLLSAARAAGDTEKRKMLEETTPDVLNAKGLLMFLRQSPSSETTSPSTSPELRPVAAEKGLVVDSARSSTGPAPVGGDRGDGVVNVGAAVGAVDGDADGGDSCGDGFGTAVAAAPRAGVAAGNSTAEDREAAPGNAAVGRASPLPPPTAQPTAAAAAPLRVTKGWEEGESVTGGGVGAGDSETPVPSRIRSRSKSTSLLSSPSSSVAHSARGGGGGGGDADGGSAVTMTLLASPWGGGGGWTSNAVPVTPVTPATPAASPKAAAAAAAAGDDGGRSVARSLPVVDTAMPMPAPRTVAKPRKPRFRLPVVTPSPSAATTPRQGQPRAPTGFAAAHVSTPAPSSSSAAAPAHQHQPVPVTPGTPSVRLAPVELFTPSPVANSGGAVPAYDASAHASAPVVHRGSSTGAAESGDTTGETVEPTTGGDFAASSKRKEEAAEREVEGTAGEAQKRPRVATS